MTKIYNWFEEEDPDIKPFYVCETSVLEPRRKYHRYLLNNGETDGSEDQYLIFTVDPTKENNERFTVRVVTDTAWTYEKYDENHIVETEKDTQRMIEESFNHRDELFNHDKIKNLDPVDLNNRESSDSNISGDEGKDSVDDGRDSVDDGKDSGDDGKDSDSDRKNPGDDGKDSDSDRKNPGDE